LGAVVTVTVLVTVSFEQPPVPVIIYRIVVVPAATAVITPVDPSTVATDALSDSHEPPEFPLDVKVVVPFEQIACVPLKVPALAAVVTVTVLVAVSFAQPPVPVTIYLIVDVPAATPVINPVLALMVATLVLVELHAPPVSPSVLKVTVPSEQSA
jgi:hypothetical protein